MQQLGQKDQRAEFAGVRLHAVAREHQHACSRASGGGDRADGAVDLPVDRQHRVLVRPAVERLERVVGSRQVPERMAGGMRFAEAHDQQIPWLPFHQSKADRLAPRDAVEIGAGERCALRQGFRHRHPVLGEGGMRSELGLQPHEEIGRVGARGAQGRMTAPAEDLGAVDAVREPGLRDVEDDRPPAGAIGVERAERGEVIGLDHLDAIIALDRQRRSVADRPGGASGQDLGPGMLRQIGGAQLAARAGAEQPREVRQRACRDMPLDQAPLRCIERDDDRSRRGVPPHAVASPLSACWRR